MADGRTIAQVAAESLIQALPISIAVVRPENKQLTALLQQAGLTVFACKESEQEMADSLSAAIRFSSGFEAASDGFVIALADMPYIQPATICSIVESQMGNRASITVPTYHGQRGHPVSFAAKYRSELERLQGDEGARAIIKKYANELCLLPCNDAGILADIDTPEDLKAKR